MDGGSLELIIKQEKHNLSMEFCAYTLKMVALGLREMHLKNVLHRDIKSMNILCDGQGRIKIADLDQSASLSA